MMRPKTEEQLLKKFDIPDWRSLKKDQVIALVSNLQKVPTEVAVKIIEQFPKYADSVRACANDYKEIIQKSIDSNQELNNAQISIAQQRVDAILVELDSPNLTFEQKTELMNLLKDVNDDLARIAKENREFLETVIKYSSFALVAVVGILGAAIGVSSGTTTKNLPDDIL